MFSMNFLPTEVSDHFRWISDIWQKVSDFQIRFRSDQTSSDRNQIKPKTIRSDSDGYISGQSENKTDQSPSSNE